MEACLEGGAQFARLLRDSRVKVTEVGNGGFTPLRSAACWGHVDVIKWWIASGREMNLGKLGNEQTDAIGNAKTNRHSDVVTLLEKYLRDPEKTRGRKELKVTTGKGSLRKWMIILGGSLGILKIPFCPYCHH